MRQSALAHCVKFAQFVSIIQDKNFVYPGLILCWGLKNAKFIAISMNLCASVLLFYRMNAISSQASGDLIGSAGTENKERNPYSNSHCAKIVQNYGE